MPNQTKESRKKIDINPGEEIVLRSKVGSNWEELVFDCDERGLLTLKPNNFSVNGMEYKGEQISFGTRQ